jgi:RNA polymerase sigma factor (TIGR02999 family)
VTSEAPQDLDVKDLLPAVYAEMRRLAGAYLRRERAAHTLEPTALAHEAFLRLADETKVRWRSRPQLLAIAARAMRQILVDHARRVGRLKRGGGRGRERLSLVDAEAHLGAPAHDLLDLDAALDALAALDERKATIVQLRFFAGLTVPDVAELLGLSTTTVEDDWYAARAWLRKRLAAPAAP